MREIKGKFNSYMSLKLSFNYFEWKDYFLLFLNESIKIKKNIFIIFYKFYFFFPKNIPSPNNRCTFIMTVCRTVYVDVDEKLFSLKKKNCFCKEFQAFSEFSWNPLKMQFKLFIFWILGRTFI